MRLQVSLLSLLAVAGAGVLCAPAVHAQTLFTENFESDAPGFGRTTLVNFNVTRGNVDVIGAGTPVNPYNSGLYLDLDGTDSTFGTNFAPGTTNASITTKSAFNLVPLTTYTLSFDLGKNGSSLESLTVSVGSAFSTVISDSLAYPTLQNRTFTFTVPSNTVANITFNQTNPGDNFGYIIDNISLIGRSSTGAAPEPGSLALVGIASLPLAGLVLRKRRKA